MSAAKEDFIKDQYILPEFEKDDFSSRIHKHIH